MWRLFLLCIMAFSSLRGELFEEMSGEEKKATGIDKLSKDEINALETWVKGHKKSLHRTLVGEFQIKAIDQKNNRFTLSDAMTYEVTRRYKKKIPNWKVGDTIRLIQTRKPVWFHFEHSTSKETLGVKRITPKSSP